MTVTDDSSCVIDSTITITEPPPITVDAGVDQILCLEDLPAILSGAVTIAGGAQWSGGTGTFSLSLDSLNNTYYPSITEIDQDSVVL